MTELLELTPQSRVLEIGTGSGYQTAILAHLVQHVCSVERIKGLQWQARRRLKNLDLHNVSTRHGDGWQGWQARAPFDAIIVTAAPPEIPTALMTQLDEGGILVLPVGEEHQYLKRVRRRGGEFIIDTVTGAVTVVAVGLLFGNILLALCSPEDSEYVIVGCDATATVEFCAGLITTPCSAASAWVMAFPPVIGVPEALPTCKV
mgnify:CR=1 FL=1